MLCLQHEKCAQLNKRVLVTGASGNLGKLICDALNLDSFEVRRASSKRANDVYFLDFENFEWGDLESVLLETEVIIHCARVTNLDSGVALAAELEFLNMLFLSGCKVLYIGSASSWLKNPSKYGKYKSTIEEFIIESGGIVITAGLIYGSNFRGQIQQLKRFLIFSPVRIVFSPVNSLYLTQIDHFLQALIFLAKDTTGKGRYLVSHSVPVSFNSILNHFCLPGYRIPLRINSRLFLKFLKVLPISSSYFSIDSFSSLLSEYDPVKIDNLGIQHISNGAFQDS